MHRVRFKICGIKTKEIAECAVENGADALGFVFYEKSPRNVSIESASSIICALPAFVGKVGVFVGNDSAFIRDVAERTGINAIQVHGDESILSTRFIKELKGDSCLPVVLAVRTEKLNAETISGIRGTDRSMKNWISNYLVDKFDTAEFGGTGKTVALEGAFGEGTDPGTAGFIRDRIILAGGINASNLEGILEKVLPFGIDVSSGVEKEKGVKDKALVKEFLEKAMRWNSKNILEGKL
jgi:phosphoribosylanthranilate isomerase